MVSRLRGPRRQHQSFLFRERNTQYSDRRESRSPTGGFAGGSSPSHAVDYLIADTCIEIRNWRDPVLGNESCRLCALPSGRIRPATRWSLSSGVTRAEAPSTGGSGREAEENRRRYSRVTHRRPASFHLGSQCSSALTVSLRSAPSAP